MASKAAQVQMQIRENSTELNDFLQDLNRWEESIKNEDVNLKTSRKLEEKLPPVRTKTRKIKKTKSSADEKNNNKNKENKERIKSYDYDAWSKYDVDAACNETSSDEGSVEEEEEDEEENEEEMEKIQTERKLQQAVMEKEKGNQLFKGGKYEAAISRYTNAITLHPTNPILYANRGMALMKTEKFGAAEQDCSTALELDPTYTKALARRATARQKLKKYNDALVDYKELLQLEPKNKQALAEIEQIQKIFAKDIDAKQNKTKAPQERKDHVDGSKDTRTKEFKKEPEMKRRRSKKPLKRILIEEVGTEEINKSDSEQKTKAAVLNDRVPQIDNTMPVSIRATALKLPIPTSSFMFETDFKKLKNDQERFYTYIKMIPTESYTKLFHQCIDALISPMVTMLLQCYVRDCVSYHEELTALTTVKRFNMAAMFLSRSNKQSLVKLFDHMASEKYQQKIDREVIKNLAEMYGIHL